MNRQVILTNDMERLREAAEWLQRLADSAADERVFIEWQQWCEADPANTRVFEQVQEVWEGFAPARVTRATPATRPPRRRFAIALAAAVSMAVGVGMWLGMDSSHSVEFHTAIGESRHEILEDGSRLELGADSRVSVRYSAEQRNLHLEKGRAFFAVARQPARPFVVHAGGLRVTAVGTEFDIRTGANSTIVTVSEGRVKIAPDEAARAGRVKARSLEPLHADAGHRVRYSKPGQILTLAKVDPRLAESWRQGVLQFQEEPLADVVGEVNRYTPRKIQLQDSRLGEVLFTGTISRDRVDDWLLALEQILPVTVEDRGTGGLLIRRRPRAAAGE